jgi:hypothetical protein
MTATTEQIKKQYTKVLIKMCKMAGLEFDSVDFKEDKWYTKHEWTQEQQNKFMDWLYDRLMKDRPMRKGLMAYPVANKHSCLMAAQSFISNFGWKVSDPQGFDLAKELGMKLDKKPEGNSVNG